MPRRTGGLASAAIQATRQVPSQQRVVERYDSVGYGFHLEESAARAVALVPKHVIGGAGGQA
jgi:hypothetical protein